MAEKKKYNSILVSGRKDQTLTYSKYVKDEESGESVKESLGKKINVTDELETQQIKDGAITNEKMAADSVSNTNLQNGSVSNKKLEDGSITNEKLAENSITKDKVQDKTIGVEKLDNELRQTIAAATGLPEDLVETIQNVDDTLKDHQSQLDEKQSQIDDKQQQITANDEDISLLQTRSTQMEETIKGIAATGGASQATAVTYDNEKSGLTAVNAQAAIDETNTKLSDLSLNKYKKCHISLIGDSISTFKDYIPNNYRTYYPQGKIDSVDKTYWHIVCKTLGASIQNLSYSGSTVTTLRYKDYNFYKRALLVDKNTSLIIVALGVNDNGMDDNPGGYDYDKDISEYNESIFTEAYIKGIRTLISNHPIADICLIRMSRAKEMIGRAKAIKTIAEHYGVMYFDASECYDGALHPDTDDNDDGSEMKKIANGLLSVLSSQSDNGYLSKLEVLDSKMGDLDSKMGDLDSKVGDFSYSTKINVSTNDDLANPKLVDVNIKAGEMIYLYISDDEDVLGNFKFTYYNGIDSTPKAFSGSSYATSKYLEIEAPENIKTLSIFGYVTKPGTLVYNVGIDAKLAYDKYLQEQKFVKITDVSKLEERITDKINKGFDVLSLGKSHNIGDVVTYDGWNYKFFNKISKVSLDKRINKGCYYVVNGKTYKCNQSTYNYIGQELEEGDIVFKDNKLNKFSNGTFNSVSYDDLLPFLSEINEEQLIVDNTLPYNTIGAHTYDIDIELGNNAVENPKLMAINAPLNSKIKVRFQGGVEKYQFTAYTSNTSTYSVFGGRIYPNMEYSTYMTKKVYYISCFIASSEIKEIGKATLHIEIDYSPITQQKTIPVVFDTDWGGDVDDGVAVSCLGWGNRIGKIKVVGAALSRHRYSTKGNAVIGLDANLHYYGIQNIPITSCDNYSKGYEGTAYNDICITYPHTLTELSSETPTSMYRRILSNLPKDVKLDIIVVGTSYNIKNLLNSIPKARSHAEYPDMLDSELDGEELVNTRVGNIYYMAGCYNEEGKSYRFNQITLNADTSSIYVHTKISDLENVKVGDVVSFRVLNVTGSIGKFKVYYKDKLGSNHEIPENKYLSVNTLYSYTLTEEATSLYIFASNYLTNGTIRVESEINRPSLMKAEANMSWNGAHTTIGEIVIDSSTELLKKVGCNVFFLGFENNCTEGAFLYGSGKTYDILYQILNAYTGGNENSWKGLDSNGNAISKWTSGCIHGWDPLTTVLAIQGHKACGFGLVQGRNEIDTNQNVDGVPNSRYGYNMFYSEDNGNHFYVYQQYSNSPFNNNRYQHMLDSIISFNDWQGNEDSEIIVLPRR